MPTASGSSYRAARVTMRSCDGSANSESTVTPKLVAATLQPVRGVTPMSGVVVIVVPAEQQHGPDEEGHREEALERPWGSSATTLPAATATTTCTSMPAQTPRSTHLAGNRAPSTSVTSPLVSTTSARKTIANVRATTCTGKGLLHACTRDKP